MFFNFYNVDIIKGEKNNLIIDPNNYQVISIDDKYYLILKLQRIFQMLHL